MKSVVVEIKNDFAAILSDDGSIVKVKNKNYVIGQVIVMKKQKKHLSKKVGLLVASVAAVVITGGVGAYAYTSPYTYVSLDVNPSIEYTLNRFETVIDVNAVNDDGQAIINELDLDSLYNKPIEEAIIETVDQISEEGYFATTSTDVVAAPETSTVADSTVQVENSTTTETVTAADSNVTTNGAIEVTPSVTAQSISGSAVIVATDSTITIEGGIVVTVSNENGSSTDDLAEAINDAITEQVGENVVVEVYSVGYQRVQEARELGVTPGKLNLVEKLKASATDPASINIEEWLKKPVKEIMKATKENKKAITTGTDAVTTENTTTEPVVTSGSAIVSGAAIVSGTAITNDAEETDKKAEEKAQKELEKAEEKAQKELEKAQKEQAKAEEKAQKELEKAEAAQERAEAAQVKAEEKKNEKALEEQEKAAKKAEEALKKAQEAQQKADEAKKKAEEKAEEKAAQAQEKATQAQEKANDKTQKEQEDTVSTEQNDSTGNGNSSNDKPKKNN